MTTGLMKCSLPACIWSGFLGCAGFKVAFVEGALIGLCAASRQGKSDRSTRAPCDLRNSLMWP